MTEFVECANAVYVMNGSVLYCCYGMDNFVKLTEDLKLDISCTQVFVWQPGEIMKYLYLWCTVTKMIMIFHGFVKCWYNTLTDDAEKVLRREEEEFDLGHLKKAATPSYLFAMPAWASSLRPIPSMNYYSSFVCSDFLIGWQSAINILWKTSSFCQYVD